VLAAIETESSEVTGQYRAWLRGSYALYKERLAELIQHPDSNVKVRPFVFIA